MPLLGRRKWDTADIPGTPASQPQHDSAQSIIPVCTCASVDTVEVREPDCDAVRMWALYRPCINCGNLDADQINEIEAKVVQGFEAEQAKLSSGAWTLPAEVVKMWRCPRYDYGAAQYEVLVHVLGYAIKRARQLRTVVLGKDLHMLRILTGLDSSIGSILPKNVFAAKPGERSVRPTVSAQRFIEHVHSWLMFNVCRPALIAKHAKNFYKFMLDEVNNCSELNHHWTELVDEVCEDVDWEHRPPFKDIVKAKDLLLEGWCQVTMLTLFRNGGLLESNKRGNAIRAFLRVQRNARNYLKGSDTFWRVNGEVPELKRGEVLFSACFPYPPEDTATDYGVPLKFDAADGGFRVLVSEDIMTKDWKGSYYPSNPEMGKLRPGDELVAVNGTRIGGSKDEILTVLSSECFPRHFDFIRDTRGETMKTVLRTSTKSKKDAGNAVSKPVRHKKGKKRREVPVTPAGSPGKAQDSAVPSQPKAKRSRKQAGTET